MRTDARGRFRVNAFVGPRFAARGGAFTAIVTAPDGQPYLTVEKRIAWPPGAVRQEVRAALPRGVLVRGQVTDKDSGQPIRAARVDFWSKGLEFPAEVLSPAPRKRAEREVSRAGGITR